MSRSTSTSRGGTRTPRRTCSIDGKLFFNVGDINTYDNDGTWVILFNKDLKSDLGIEDDLYALARDGEWTFDKFAELCKGVTRDSNADGVLDEFDTWGFGTETYNVFIHTVAAGESIVKKDADDIPYFTFRSESTYSALNKIMDFYLDKSTVMIANDGRFDSKGYSTSGKRRSQSFPGGPASCSSAAG